jgi:hypothetical protein
MINKLPFYVVLNPALTGEGLKATLRALRPVAPPAAPRPQYTPEQVAAMLREPCCGKRKKGGT